MIIQKKLRLTWRTCCISANSDRISASSLGSENKHSTPFARKESVPMYQVP
jgi:hypothetical protein